MRHERPMAHRSMGSVIRWRLPTESAHEPFWRSFMNLCVDAVYLTRGSLRSISPALKNKHAVSSLGSMRTIKSEAQFDGHVETRNAAGYFDTRQIVDREIGFFDQPNNRVQTSLIRYRYRGVSPKPELCQANDVREVKILEASVVRDVKEDRLNAPSPRHVISSGQIAGRFRYVRFSLGQRGLSRRRHWISSAELGRS